MKRPLYAVLFLCVLWLSIRWMNGQFSSPNVELSGPLSDCPDSPNCVSTLAENESQQIEPIPLDRSGEKAIQTLAAIIRPMPRSKIVTEKSGYLHVQFKSRFLGFIDDVEFEIDQEKGFVHFRSASRVGYGDFGANRKRMEQIRNLYSSK